MKFWMVGANFKRKWRERKGKSKKERAAHLKKN
jgi:hypothetical protein